MSLSYYSVLGLNREYSFEQLENAYNKKVKDINESATLSDIEKHLLLSSMKKYFDQAYIALARRNFFSSENLLNPVFETPFIFKSRLPSFGESLREMNTILEERPPLSFPSSQDSGNTTVYSSSTTYRERTMPDGSKIVLKETSDNRNGNVTRTTNSYRQLASGATEPIDYENALLQTRQLESRT